MYQKKTVNGKTRPVHDIFMEEILGRPLAKDEVVHHINGDKTDNQPEHTRLHATGRTQSPEAIERIASARRGTSNRSARLLSDEQVTAIVHGFAEGRSTQSLAEEYGVSTSTIKQIRAGKTYRDVLATLPEELFPLGKRQRKYGAVPGIRQLSPEEVTVLRLALLEGRAVTAVAEEFGLSNNTVARIRDGETYRDIPAPEKIGELTVMRDLHHIADRMLSSSAPTEEEDRLALLNEYALYPTYEAYLCLRILRRALAGDRESICLLYALSSYDEEFYRAVEETAYLANIAGTNEIIISMMK